NSQCNPLNSSRFILGRNLRKRDISDGKKIVIEYKITGLSDENEEIFKRILKGINDNTCFHFKENLDLDGKGKNEVFRGNLFKIKEFEFCNCPKGIDQQVVFEFNKYDNKEIYYDIGRPFGLPFEHTRTDRDNFVKIINEIIYSEQDDFRSKCPMKEIITVPYDFGSAMHYSSKKNSFDGNVVIQPIKYYTPYKDTMGQYGGFSFNDYKKINKIHCNNVCKFGNPCKKNGYLNPKTCNKCLCPYPFDPNENCKQFIGKLKECSKIYILTEEKKTETVPSEESNNFDCFYEF
uniref:Metalloendopeptidase n=1 Tax=Parastrongyloides trichosuri TaxID=131310 RepID=A0A0N4Z6D0_PARTI